MTMRATSLGLFVRMKSGARHFGDDARPYPGRLDIILRLSAFGRTTFVPT